MASDYGSIRVVAGPHDRRDCPVSIALPQEFQGGCWRLILPGGERVSLQPGPEGKHFTVLPTMLAHSVLTAALAADSPTTAVNLSNDGAAIAIQLHGDLFTRYHYRASQARPFFYPLLAATGDAVTRGYPMSESVPNESQDHPHHKSLWIAFGDVNGVDNWSEGSGHGSTSHSGVISLTSGPVFGSFETKSVWLSASGELLLDQDLAVTAWAASRSIRILDFEISLSARSRPVTFADTKEGGILSVRVASSMDVARGGRIENSYGGIDEAETWGRSAHWCSYSGPVEDRHLGLAILDHPLSFRYPTHWHVRNYGLMTANPFGYAAYTDGKKRGDHTLEPGDSMRFRYRLIVHDGNAAQGDVRGRYLDYVSPPTLEFVAPV